MPEMQKQKKHSVMLDNRSRLSLSGVEDVKGFNEEIVSMKTVCGTLVIKGSGLHIDKLNLETGDVSVEGKINAMQYLSTDDRNTRLSRLFK